MGRQVQFFMSDSDEMEFLDLARDRNDLIMDTKANQLTVEGICGSDLYKVYLAMPALGAIVQRPSGYITDSESRVVEFVRCQRGDKTIDKGRIWAELKDYDLSGRPVSRSEQLEDMYNFYAKWIKKHYKISKDKRFYIARDAYHKYKEEGYIMRSGAYQPEFD